MRLGWNHTDGESVMQPAGSFYSIQDSDVKQSDNYTRKNEFKILAKSSGPQGAQDF